eukprot:gene1307-32657_t
MSSVPVGLAIVLCVFCFVAGRYLQQNAELPDAGSTPQARRALTMTTSDLNSESVVSSQQAKSSQPGIDPLDPAQLENYLLDASGLLNVRPPVPVGQSGDDFVRLMPFQILSWCDHIIALAKEEIYPSGLAYRPGEEVEEEQQTRTSEGAFLSTDMDPTGVLAWVEERIAAAALMPRENGEPFNVLQYQHLQHYDSHMDSFDPKEFGPQRSQRVLTILAYLSDVTEGGETVFKKEGINDGSFTYAPRQGDAIFFWSTTPDGDIDSHALHGGCPVKNGTKW